MKKKILFILNTYEFMSRIANKNQSIKKNYMMFNNQDKNWTNYFYNNLKKNYYVEKDYPNFNKNLLVGKNYLTSLEEKINKFKPDLIFSSIDDINIEKIINKFKKIKKIIWISYKIDKKKVLSLKKNYNFLISDNQLILKQAKKIDFSTFELLISNENVIDLNERNYQKRNNALYFAGSLGSDFTYRLESLLFLKKNYNLKLRVRNLVEKYKILNLLNGILLTFLPNLTKYLFKKKFLPISNELKFINEDEIFGKSMLTELKKYKFCINIHSDFDQNNAINSRVFEALACGCLLFTDENKFMKNFFLGNKHVIYFKSKDDLREKVNYYLLNPKAAYKIAKNGNQLFIKKHQSKVRIKEFKKIIKSIRI